MVDSRADGVQGPKSQTSQIYFLPTSWSTLSKGQSRILQDTGTLPLEKAGQMVAAQSGSSVGGTFAMDRLAFAGQIDAVGGSNSTSRPRWWLGWVRQCVSRSCRWVNAR